MSDRFERSQGCTNWFRRHGEFGQDYFTLYATYFEGRPPKSVNMHWRRFAIKDIPVTDSAAFEIWLRERWIEKDQLLDFYAEHGRFPEDEDAREETKKEKATSGLRQRIIGGQERTINTTGGTNADGKWDGPVETEVKIGRWWDVLDIFTVAMWVSPVVYVQAFFSLFMRWFLWTGKHLGFLR